MHIDTLLDSSDATVAHNDFLRWVSSILPKDKFAIFSKLFNSAYPLPTNGLCHQIYGELARVFQSQDFYEKYTFVKTEFETDFVEYRKKVLNENDFIRNKLWKSIQTGIDNVLVVDLPKEPTGKIPEPYYYILDVSCIIDILNDNTGTCQYLIFRHGDKAVVYDDTSFRVYGYKDNLLSPLPEIEIEHGLGYCPARSIWSMGLIIGNEINKCSPITHEIADLNWLLFHAISKRYLDMYASYPIYITYETAQNFEQFGSDDKNTLDQPTINETESGLIGAGSNLTVPPPLTKDDPDLLANPIKVIPAEIGSLEYNVKEQERLKDKIFKACVGTGGEPVNDQAKNEMQVMSSFESRENILTVIGENIAIIQEFGNSTVARLRYGRDYFISGKVSYGHRFHLETENDLIEDYSDAKKNGDNIVILDSLNSQIIQRKFKDDSTGMERAKIINDLDPFPLMTIAEVRDLAQGNLITSEQALIKFSLIDFVRRFERENISLPEFGKDTDYQTKINNIKLKFKEYASEQKSGVPNQ